MDFQSRAGSKFGGGGIATEQQAALHRKEQLRRLALEQIDISKDPYFMRNHLGTVECKLCRTIHTNEGNYLAHTQGKRHTVNIARRAAREATEKESGVDAKVLAAQKPLRDQELLQQRILRKPLKIGRPGYKIVKIRDPETNKRTLKFEISYPDIKEGIQPRHRFMSSFEQKIEAPDRRYQYLIFSAEPYESIAFKVPNDPINRSHGQFISSWNRETKFFTLEFSFLVKNETNS